MTDHEAIARVEDAWAAVEKIAASQSDIGLAVILCDAVNRSRDLAKQVGGLREALSDLVDAHHNRPSGSAIKRAAFVKARAALRQSKETGE